MERAQAARRGLDSGLEMRKRQSPAVGYFRSLILSETLCLMK
jgi:hypothetical protein